MKENNYEVKEGLININSDMNIASEKNDLLNNKVIGKDLIEEEKEPLDLSNIKLEEIELGSTIFCPEQNCFSNPIISIDPIFFDVSCDCGDHKNKMDIIEFAIKAGKSKENNDKCFKCEQTYDNLKNEKKKLYKCYCGNNFCKECKEEHLKENIDNKNEHNMIDYKEKDYKCCCTSRGKKYLEYCVSCKKNLCIMCPRDQCKDNNHKLIIFGDSFKLSQDKKQSKIEEVEEQRKQIEEFNGILDHWLDETKRIIKIYKKKIELYNKINSIIINQYNSNKLYYQAIKNAEYIRLDFDDNFYKLIKAKNDYKLQNSIICKILKENIEKYKPPEKVKNNKILTKINSKNYLILNGLVKNICELKKNKFLIANIISQTDNKEGICIFRKMNTEKYEHFISKEVEGKIISLIGLKNNNLLIVKDKQYNIWKIDESQNQIKDIQTFEIKNSKFKQIIELINGYLVSIIYSNKDKKYNEIAYWKKNLINENYEKIKSVKTNEEPLGILEIDKHYFLVNFDGNNIRIYSSKTMKEKYKQSIKNQLNIKKMIKIDEENILMFNGEYTILFNLKHFQIKISDVQTYINDILYISNSNNYFFSILLKDNIYCISLLNLNLYKDNIISFIGNNINTEEKIKCLYELSDGTIINGSDNKIKFWKIN